MPCSSSLRLMYASAEALPPPPPNPQARTHAPPHPRGPNCSFLALTEDGADLVLLASAGPLPLPQGSCCPLAAFPPACVASFEGAQVREGVCVCERACVRVREGKDRGRRLA